MIVYEYYNEYRNKQYSHIHLIISYRIQLTNVGKNLIK